MSKSKPRGVRKLNLDKRAVRKLSEADLTAVAGGEPKGPQEPTLATCKCPSGNLCCVNHNQALRRR